MNKLRLLAGILLATSAFGLDTAKLKPTGYVNDFAHALDPRNTRAIEAYCGEVERATGAQFAVAVIDSLEGDPIEDVANKLYRQWGVGKKGKDEGVLLLLAIKDRKQRAEVGYGLEPIIPDGYAGSVLRGIRPILRQGNYGGAVLAAMEQFGSEVANSKGVALENVPHPRSEPTERRGPGISPIFFIIGIFIVIAIIRFISGGFGGGYGGGYGGGSGLGGFITGMILGNMMGRRGPWGGGGGWGGGGFGDGGGGGGGFGGFGGGDSGGGGASSDW